MSDMHRIEVEPEQSETVAKGGAHRVVIYDRGGSANSQVVRLHEAELVEMYRKIGRYLDELHVRPCPLCGAAQYQCWSEFCLSEWPLPHWSHSADEDSDACFAANGAAAMGQPVT